MTIELSLSRAASSPASELAALAASCEDLGVTSFDVYGDYAATDEASWLRRFEHEVAAHFGHKEGLFLSSGVMAQLIMLMATRESAVDPELAPFVCHYSSHVLLHEQNAHEKLLRVQTRAVGPEHGAVSQQPLSFEQVEAELATLGPKPFAVLLEVPHREIGGKCSSWTDMAAMSVACRERGVHFHMDGARVWEASAAFPDKSSQELGRLFDSMYVSFYKGLGGVTGAMLIGSSAFIERCLPWQRRFGGNLFSLMPYGVSAWRAFRANKDVFPERLRVLRSIVAELTARFITGRENPILRFDPPVPEVSLIHIYLNVAPSATEMETDVLVRCLTARDQTVADTGISCFSRLRVANVAKTAGQCYFEMNLGPGNIAIPLEDWVRGWGHLLALLA